MAKNDTPKGVKCSFCGKTQDSVRKIVAGPGVYICNECIELCNEIIESEYYEEDNDTYTLAGLEKIPSPKEIKEILDQYVIGQDEAKKHYQLQYIIIIKELLMKKNWNLNMSKMMMI